MKKGFMMLLAALLLCLPVWAMAEGECPFTVKDAHGNVLEPASDGLFSWNDDQLHIRASGLTVSGGGPKVSIWMHVCGELTLENASFSAVSSTTGAALLAGTSASGFAQGTLTLIFKGTNHLTADVVGIGYTNNVTGLHIQMAGGSSLTIDAQIPIADASDPSKFVPVSAADIASGDGTIIANGDVVYQHSTPAISYLPQTGDNSNVFLWYALAAMSLAGIVILTRKKKEA